MKRWIFVIILLYSSGLLIKAHPVHVSLCNIEIEEKNIIVSVKLFRDDFQLALQHNYGEIIDFEKPLVQQNKKLMYEYINKQLKIVLNNRQLLSSGFQKTEMNEDAIWLYYYLEAEDFSRINIKNELFLDIYQDQTNLLIVNFAGKQVASMFNRKNTVQEIDLK